MYRNVIHILYSNHIDTRMSKCTYKTNNLECTKGKQIGVDQFIEYRSKILSPSAMVMDCIVHRAAP